MDELRQITAEIDRRAKWAMIITSLIGAVMFSITLPSLPFYLDALDLKQQPISGQEQTPAKTQFLGIVVAAYSAGQLLASPAAGWSMNQLRSAKGPILMSLTLLAASNMLYALAWNRYVALLARFIVGLGASNATISRAYLSQMCRGDDLSRMMAWLSASQAAGFILGPVFGMALSFFLPVGGIQLTRWAILDSMTSPGYISALLALLNIVFVSCSGQLSTERCLPEIEPMLTEEGLQSSTSETTVRHPYDIVGVWILNLVFMLTILGFAIFQTILYQECVWMGRFTERLAFCRVEFHHRFISTGPEARTKIRFIFTR